MVEFKQGEIRSTKSSGDYEIIKIISSKEVYIKFIETGFERVVRYDVLRSGAIKDNSLSKPIREGDIFSTVEGGDIEVLECLNSREIKIRFLEYGYETFATATHIRMGNIRNRLKPALYGIGISDLSLPNSDKCKKVWTQMFSRCYSLSLQSTQGYYAACSVAELWHKLSDFKIWFDLNYVEGWQLDKDILLEGNKVYGPQNCAFLPAYVNSTFNKSSENLDNKLLLGVANSPRFSENRPFIARYSRKYLGSFKTCYEAHRAWQKAKIEHLTSLIEKYKNEPKGHDIRIEGRLFEIVDALKDEYSSGKITRERVDNPSILS